MALMPMLGATTSVLGGILDYQKLGRENKEIEVATDLQNRAIRKENRQAVGQYISDVGASGVELTLDQISLRNKEAALSIAVNKDYAKRQQSANKAEGIMAITSGLTSAALEFAQPKTAKTGTMKTKNPYQYSSMWGKSNPVKGLQTIPQYGPLIGAK